MQVAIVSAYVRESAGDAALLSVLIDQLRHEWPDAQLTVSGMEDPARRREFDGVRNVGSIRRYSGDETISRWRRIARKALTASVVSVWGVGGARRWTSVTRRLPSEVRDELDAIRTADLVVFVGGGHLWGRPGLAGDLNVGYLLAPLRLARRLGHPVVLAPQSFGPFATTEQQRATRRVLSDTDLILVREDVSYRILSELGVRAPLRRAVDSGFAFVPSPNRHWRQDLGVDADQTLVGITARRWLDGDAQTAYERALATLADDLLGRGLAVVLIPQVVSAYRADDDRLVNSRIAGLMSATPRVVTGWDDHRDLAGLYGELDLLVGTRFHSVIFALSSGTPCVAIAYEHKTTGIMDDLGLGDWVIPIDQVTPANLTACVQRVLAAPQDYRATLDRTMPDYKRRAAEVGPQIRAVWNEHGKSAH